MTGSAFQSSLSCWTSRWERSWGVAHAILVIAEEIGLGLITGIVLAAIAVRLLRLAVRYGWTSEHWLHVPVVALAALCFATAQTLGGSGFIVLRRRADVSEA